VFRAVGLAGEGGTGDLSGAIGDLSDKVGLVTWAVEVEMLKDNLGFADREASMLTVVCFDVLLIYCLLDVDLCGLEVLREC